MKTITSALRGLAAFSLATLPLAVQAQADTSGTTDEAQRLNPMVVTAALAARTADQSLSSVTVLDEATLRRQDPVSVTELLRGQPGVDVTSNGSFGKNSSVYIRGTSSDQNVLLIDGIRLRSATSGGAAWQFLDLRMFERAEIVRGPRGSLYGADAVGGVVQLFTRQPEEGGPSPGISLGGGSFDTQRASATLSGESDGTRYSFAASRFDTEGAPVRRGGDDKGYDNTSALARVAHTFDSGAELGVLALRSRGNTEFDGGDTDFVQQVAGVYAEIPVTDDWRSRLTLSESRDESDNFLEATEFAPATESIFDTRTRTARWENTFHLAAHELVAGIEHSEDKVDGRDTSPFGGFDDYDVQSRDNLALFTQGLLDFSPVTLQASLRYDDNEAFGEEVTGGLALGIDLDTHHTLRTSIGTAFRAPTFNELYYPDVGFFVGNPELKAETSTSFEVGVRGQYSAFFWDLAGYQTDIDDFIGFSGTRNENISKARIRGVELSAGTELDDWTLQAALTYTDPENRGDDGEKGNRLPRRSTQSLRLDVDRELGDWSLGSSWIAQNHRYDDAANEDRLSGFGLVNLRAGWQFAPLWSARVSVENVFDKQYETASDYINAGRAAMVSVDYGL